jgi:hypothetical protein
MRRLQRPCFFDKGNILISIKYQLHPASATTHCLSDNTDAHSQKKKEELQKRKSPTTVIKSLFQRTKHNQDNTRNPSSPKTMPPCSGLKEEIEMRDYQKWIF